MSVPIPVVTVALRVDVSGVWQLLFAAFVVGAFLFWMWWGTGGGGVRGYHGDGMVPWIAFLLVIPGVVLFVVQRAVEITSSQDTVANPEGFAWSLLVLGMTAILGFVLLALYFLVNIKLLITSITSDDGGFY